MLRAAMLFALSTTSKIAVAGMGAAFIVCSLISAMVIPRMKPDFPGKNLRVYLAVSGLFFVAMISAILIFAKEKKKPEAATEQTTTAANPAPAATGDPTAGKVVF